VRSSSGMLVQTERATTTSPPCDFLMVTASYGHRALCSSQVLSALRVLCANAKCLVGLDTGSWLLAAAGQLNDSPATIHGHVFESFSETFTQVDARQERFVIDGNRITCGGAMASFDLVLTLIGAHCGEITRLDVAALFLRQTNQPFGDADNISIRSRLVAGALVLMDQNIEAPVPIPIIAQHLGCSLKSLQRRFERSLDATPGQVYRHRRLIAVRSLVRKYQPAHLRDCRAMWIRKRKFHDPRIQEPIWRNAIGHENRVTGPSQLPPVGFKPRSVSGDAIRSAKGHRSVFHWSGPA